MAELILLYACWKAQGCAETASQYRLYNPAPFDWAEQSIDRVNKIIFTGYWAPVVAYAYGREGTIRLSTNVGLRLGQQSKTIVYTVEF